MSDQPRQLGHTLVAVGITSTQVAAANTNRTYLLIQNDDATNDIYLKFGAAAVAGEGIRLNAGGGSLEISGRNGNLDTRVINGIAAVASDALVTEA